MIDTNKTKEQLAAELTEMQQRIADSEAVEAERQRLAEALSASEAQYRALVEQVPAIIYTAALDQASTTLYVSPQIEKLLGLSQDDWANDPDFWRKRLHPDDRERVLAELHRSHESGDPFRCEYRMLACDGRVVWFHDEAAVVQDAAGNPLVLLGTMLDITERKQAEEELESYREHLEKSVAERTAALTTANKQLQQEIVERQRAEEAIRESRQTLLRVVENMPVLFDALDEQGVALFWNKECERATGYSAEEIVGNAKSLELLCPDPEYRAWVAEQLQELNHDYHDWEIEIQRKDGERRIIAWSNTSRHHPVPGWWSWGTGVDVTERVRVEEALRESNHRLEETLAELRETQEKMVQQERLAAVGQLAAGIAHDFNNILASMVLYTQMSLRTDELSPQVRQRLETIAQQARRATDLIQQILDFSRRAVIERRPLLLDSFLGEVVELLRRTLPENILIDLICEPVPSADGTPDVEGRQAHTIEADPTRVQQAIVNLALNARDAMPGGGELHITLSRTAGPKGIKCVTCGQVIEGEWVQVAVTDTGTGIPPDVLPHIFEPFFTTRAPLGSGLGLAQVYGIVKQHEGHIAVETELGRGTTFKLYWPTPPLSQPQAPTEEWPALTEGNGETILVVEDDPAMRVALVDALETLNYHTLEAADGREALATFEQHKSEISLIMSDWVMPLMGGLELVRELRQRRSAVKVLMLTGHPLDERTEATTPEGVIGWLLKPPGLKQLANAVARAIERQDKKELLA
jgi:PAS domain S-box-containing protein